MSETSEIIILIGFIAIVVLYSYFKAKKEHAARAWYLDVNVNYAPEVCGLYKLYDGLPLKQNTECLVAYSNGDIIIKASHYDLRIVPEDIINLRIDTIQEGYTKTSVFGFSAVGVGLGVASAIGNSAKKAAARKKVFIITSTQGEIYFLTPNTSSIGFFAKKDLEIRGQLTSIPRRPSSKTLKNIIGAWESDYTAKRLR
jgi:hypothetical protein